MTLTAAFNPAQARAPRGTPIGGRWIDTPTATLFKAQGYDTTGDRRASGPEGRYDAALDQMQTQVSQMLARPEEYGLHSPEALQRAVEEMQNQIRNRMYEIEEARLIQAATDDPEVRQIQRQINVLQDERLRLINEARGLHMEQDVQRRDEIIKRIEEINAEQYELDRAKYLALRPTREQISAWQIRENERQRKQNEMIEALVTAEQERTRGDYVGKTGDQWTQAERNQAMLDALTPTLEQYDMSAEVTSSSSDGYGGGDVNVTLYDYAGSPVGTIERRFDSSGEVTNAYFRLNPNYQGQGIGSKLTAAMEDQWRAAGFSQVNVHANIDVGGYTWARQGFELVDPDDIYRLVDRVETFADTPDELADIADIRERLDYGEQISIGELATVGWRGDGTTDWAGKEGLLGADWYGYKPLGDVDTYASDPDQTSPTTIPDDARRRSAQIDALHRAWVGDAEYYSIPVPGDQPSQYPETEEDVWTTVASDAVFMPLFKAIVKPAAPPAPVSLVSITAAAAATQTFYSEAQARAPKGSRIGGQWIPTPLAVLRSASRLTYGKDVPKVGRGKKAQIVDLDIGSTFDEIEAERDRLADDILRREGRPDLATTAARVLDIYDRTSPELREASAVWYDNANALAQRMVDDPRTDLTLEQAAAVIAHQSSQTNWATNEQAALAIAAGARTPEEVADYLKAARAADMAATGKDTSQILSGTLGSNTKNAVKAVDSDDPIGDGTHTGTFSEAANKTRTFAANIAGDVDGVTVDTWMYRVLGQVREVTGGIDGVSKVAREDQVYEALAQAVRVAARERGLPPSTIQAITWVWALENFTQATATTPGYFTDPDTGEIIPVLIDDTQNPLAIAAAVEPAADLGTVGQDDGYVLDYYYEQAQRLLGIYADRSDVGIMTPEGSMIAAVVAVSYRPDQARAPRGTRIGGQWIRTALGVLADVRAWVHGHDPEPDLPATGPSTLERPPLYALVAAAENQARAPRGTPIGGQWIPTPGATLASARAAGGGIASVDVEGRTFSGTPAPPHGREAEIRERGYSTPTMLHSKGDPESAAAFAAAIERSKEGNRFGASVYVYPAEEYQDMDLWLTEDGQAGIALHGDDIVSAFNTPGSAQTGFVQHAMAIAQAAGGRRADAFDTVLPKIYAQAGMKVVARVPWDDDYAPDGWDKSTYAKFNGGEPDVVFLVYDPDGWWGVYEPGSGQVVGSYDEGIEVVEAMLADAEQQPPLAASASGVQRHVDAVVVPLASARRGDLLGGRVGAEVALHERGAVGLGPAAGGSGHPSDSTGSRATSGATSGPLSIVSTTDRSR